MKSIKELLGEILARLKEVEDLLGNPLERPSEDDAEEDVDED